MIIKFVDVYLDTRMTSDSASHQIDKYLEEYMQDVYDFDLENFIEILSDSEKFEVIDFETEESAEVVYTQEDIDELIDRINENNSEDGYFSVDLDEHYEEDEDEGWE